MNSMLRPYNCVAMFQARCGPNLFNDVADHEGPTIDSKRFTRKSIITFTM